MTAKNTETVKVIVRTRPMNAKEFENGSQCIVGIDQNLCQVILEHPNQKETPRTFTFDMVYGMDSKQQEVYDECGFSLVENVIEGYNGTMFAYGQTGCGKTHTMMGPSNPKGPEFVAEEDRGIIPKVIRHIFNFIDGADKDTKFLVRCSYLEIYNEKVLDLLNLSKEQEGLQIKEDPTKGPYVKDLTTVITKTVAETEKALFAGLKGRKVGATAMNADSSRSHSMFTIYIETASDDPISGKQKIKAGKLNLVDLAGSERQSKTQATGVRLDEAKAINVSLSALGNVIKALVDGNAQHIPYRDSKLTRLLQDSLGGNTKTVMVAALSPANYNYDETLSTLRYADRAKSIKNKPKINEDPKDALLKQYESEIQELKMMLQQMQMSGATSAQMTNAMNMMSFKMERQHNLDHVEDNIDTLLARLEGHGKKVKIMTEEEEALELVRQQERDAEIRQEMDKIEQEKNRLNQDKELIANELQEKEQKLRAEQQEKEALESMLKELNNKLVSGGQHLQEKEAEQLAAKREYQKKLKEQRKKAQKLEEEKIANENALIIANTQFKDMEEELKATRQIMARQKEKYDNAANEIRDLQKEHNDEKEDLMIQLRQQDLDIKFYRQVVDMVMKPEELAKLKSKSSYDDGMNEWSIPVFLLKAREVALPSLSIKKQAAEFMDAQKNERIVVYEDDMQDQHSNSAMSQNQYNNGFIAQYEAANQRRSANDFDAQQPGSRAKVVSRGRVQITQNFTPATVSQSKTNKKWSNTEPFANGGSVLNVPNNANQTGYSPDIPLSKNSRATAQLAPLNHFSAVGQGLAGAGAENNLIQSLEGRLDRKQLPEMPSIDLLQQSNKLQPLNHIPRKR